MLENNIILVFEPFLNIQAGSIYLVNVITLHKLPVSSCNLIVVFSTSKSWTSLMLSLCDLFELSKLLKVRLPCEHVNPSAIACIML